MNDKVQHIIDIIKNQGSCTTKFARCEECYLEQECNSYIWGAIPDSFIYEKAVEYFLSFHSEEELAEILL